MSGESSYEEFTVTVAGNIETNDEEAIRFLTETNAVSLNFLNKFRSFIKKKFRYQKCVGLWQVRLFISLLFCVARI